MKMELLVSVVHIAVQKGTSKKGAPYQFTKVLVLFEDGRGGRRAGEVSLFPPRDGEDQTQFIPKAGSDAILIFEPNTGSYNSLTAQPSGFKPVPVKS